MAADSLAGLHPKLSQRVQTILDGMRAFGFPMKVLEGVRSDERQRALFAQGRTAPGPIVTRCDGVTHRSRHQQQPDGFGHAVDCVFESSTPFEGPWKLYGAAAEALELVWGGTFSTIVDRPHVELPRDGTD